MKNDQMILSAAKRRKQEAVLLISDFKSQIQPWLDKITTFEKKKSTGWFVLLKIGKDDEVPFKVVAIFNPDESEEDLDEEWDLAIPIPEPDTMPEFTGW